MPSILFLLFLVILAIVLVACALAFAFLEKQRKKQVSGLLRTVSAEDVDEPRVSILSEQPGQRGPVAATLERLRLGQGLQTNISQAGLDWDANQVVVVMLVLSVVGFMLGFKFHILLLPVLSNLGLALVLGALPYLYIRFKRKRRLAEFEEQFPEALDFLARSMRAGHAFSVSLEMLGEESPEPLGREFRTLFNEQNLGASIDLALANFAQRMPLLDVKFFVSSVMLQKQTGGNLSEILMRLGYIIRERFRLKGQVKAASAHARITAGILTVMPIALAIGLMLIAPGYLQTMARDPDGKYLILGSIAAQVVGYFVIRRIIDIKV